MVIKTARVPLFFQRYHGAHVLLHALQFQTQDENEKDQVTKYKNAVEKRLEVLKEHGFVQTFETMTH